MDEDATGRVVTRLRRRLSVENEEPKSPATPTKKRGGRLAAKPNLENIDELATISSPKRTRKSVARDIVDSDKPLTPSRRNTRITSTTSVTSDITQSCDSPRALRAARRNSLTGSENDLSIKAPSRTYGRSRTRKDSSSSIESQGEPVINNKNVKTLTEDAIVEESNGQNSNDSAKEPNESVVNKSPAEIRRSPRLNAKKDVQYSASMPYGSDEDAKSNKDSKDDGVTLNNDSSSQAGESQHSIKKETVSNENTPLKDFKSVTVTVTKMDVKHINKETKKIQSTSLIESSTERNKSNRSKSLSFSKSDSDSERKFFSDNDNYKQNVIINQGLAEIIKNHIMKDNTTKNDYEPIIQSSVMQCDAPIIKSTIYLDYTDPNIDSVDKITTSKEKNTESEDQCVPSVVDQSLNKELKEIPPQNNDPETDPCLTNMSNCIEKSNTSIINNSCEPMDVDEIIPEIISLNTSAQYNKLNEIPTEPIKQACEAMVNPLTLTNNSASSLSTLHVMVDMSSSRIDIDKYNKSPRKSDLDISPQLKVDMSSSRIDINKYNKSQGIFTIPAADVSIENKENRRISNCALPAETPTKHTNTQQLEIQTSTPFNETNLKKDKSVKNSVGQIKNSKLLSKSSFDESNSSVESFNENSLLDNEAEDAGNDYESGDSQDEEEKRYVKENEIVEKGETLTSDDEQLSSGSDYEKDSFVVSSDEEDNDLISGSGDDLASSDNELNMTAKSKKKYNERKAKEQKLASREMYEARHNLKNNPKNKSKSAILSDSSDDTDTGNLNESEIRPVVKNRRRFDSTTDANKSDNDNTIVRNTKNKKKFIESSDDSSLEEKEMTAVYDESKKDVKDPLSNSTIIVEKTMSPVKEIDATIRDEMEEIHVDENVTMMKNNMTSDPLAETLVDIDTSSSENEEIMQDYDKVLDNLNDLHSKKKFPAKNASLNLGQKQKQIKNEPIIDQLNLTLTKPSVRKQNMQLLKNETKGEETHSSKIIEHYHHEDQSNDDNSSDSIDLKLLFPDESSDESEPFKGFESEDFIPLRKSKGKTNLLENFESTEDANLGMSENQSKKQKKKNRKHSATDSINDEQLVEKSKSSRQKSTNTNENAPDITENVHNEEAEKQPKKRKNKNSKVATAESTHEKISNTEEIVEKSPRHKRGSSSANVTETHEENIPCSQTEKRKKKKNRKHIAAVHNVNDTLIWHDEADNEDTPQAAPVSDKRSKKRKRKRSNTVETVTDDANVDDGHVLSQEPDLAAGSHKKRIKRSNSNANNQIDDIVEESVVDAPYDATSGHKKKKKYTRKQKLTNDVSHDETDARHKTENLVCSNIQVKNYSKLVQLHKNEETSTGIAPLPIKRSKKRVTRDEDHDDRKTKSVKVTENPWPTHVPRLSTAVIEQLETKPKRPKIDMPHRVISTTSFDVEETKVKKNKPSQYLEESIHVDSKSPERKKKKPKLLSFAPTASSSACGFTTIFKVNVNPKEANFVAQSTDMNNFKNDHLYNKNIKRQGTYELYKKQRSIKLSKF